MRVKVIEGRERDVTVEMSECKHMIHEVMLKKMNDG